MSRRDEIISLLEPNVVGTNYATKREVAIILATILEPYVIERELAEARWWASCYRDNGPKTLYANEQTRLTTLERELALSKGNEPSARAVSPEESSK